MNRRGANPVLRASPEAIAAMNERLREAAAVEVERLAAAKAAEAPKLVLTVVPPAPRQASPPTAPELPLRRPQLVWADTVPIILPDAMEALTKEQQDYTKSACKAVAKLAQRKPSTAAALALKLEAFLGTAPEDRSAVWTPIRAVVAILGAPAAVHDVAEYMRGRRTRGVRGPSQVQPLPPPAERDGPKKPKKAMMKDAKHSDGPTPERAKKSTFVEERKVSVSTEKSKGDPAWNEDALPLPATILDGRAMKDEGSAVKTRLARFGLESEHVAAGVRLATDWEKSALEPRMTANLLATGGGSSSDAWSSGKSLTTMDARDRVHYAMQALALGGQDVVHVIEAVVLRGESSTRAASANYLGKKPDRKQASAHVAANLKTGLNLLTAHYKIAARQAHERATRKRALQETA